MHRIYNRMLGLFTTLWAVCDTKKLRVGTDSLLHRKTAAGTNVYSIGSTQTQFLQVVPAAMEKLKKYLFKHMDVAKQARVLDPTQIGGMSHDISQYPHVIPSELCPRIEQSGEWKSYLDSVQPSTQKFDILGWWEGMQERLPLLYQLYQCARRTLAIPHTSCDVERSFSMWKRVRSEKQHSMQHGTHKAYVSFCFNGAVPPA